MVADTSPGPGSVGWMEGRMGGECIGDTSKQRDPLHSMKELPSRKSPQALAAPALFTAIIRNINYTVHKNLVHNNVQWDCTLQIMYELETN